MGTRARSTRLKASLGAVLLVIAVVLTISNLLVAVVPFDLTGALFSDTHPMGGNTFSTASSFTTWCDTSYGYRQRLTVTAGSEALPNGYSVSFTFDHASLVSAGKVQADGDDIRVHYWNGSACVELDRVLDPGSSWNGASTQIWFDLQASIGASASDSYYYLYYGNSSATSPPMNADAGAVVKSVQSDATTSSGNGTVTVPISSVDPSKAFLVFNTRHNSNRPPGSMVRGRIASSTALEFVRVTNGTSTMSIQSYVVEYASGVKVQRGEFAQSATTTNVGITAVAAVNQAFVTWSKTPAATDGNWNGDDPIVCELTSTTNLQCRVNTANAAHVVWWQVVEFPNPATVNVQRGSTSMTITETSQTVTLGTSVDANKTFVLVGYRAPSSGPDVGARMLRAQLTNSTTITVDRSITGSEAIDEIVWQAVELKDATTVQRGSENFGIGVGQKVVNIASVDLNRAVAFGSVQPVGGQNMGRSPYAGDDIIGVGSVTMALSATQITMDRVNTADTADIGWFVAEFKELTNPTISAGDEQFYDGPAAPTNLVATPGLTQVTLDWADNTEPDLAGYNVYRSTASGGPYTKINGALVATSDYTDTGLTNGTTYYYVVTAEDTVGLESSNSTQVSATPGSISFDFGSSASANATGTTLTISHTVGSNNNRMLVVGAQAEDQSATDCDVVSVTYNSVALTKITEATAGTTLLQCVDLWYLTAPDTGTHNIVITWNGVVDNRSGGGISLYNVAQAAPEASNSQALDSATSITTSVTTLSAGAWVVDAVGSGKAGAGFSTGEPGQTERYDTAASSSAGAGSTREVATPGPTNMTWSQAANRLAHAVAAFAPAN